MTRLKDLPKYEPTNPFDTTESQFAQAMKQVIPYVDAMEQGRQVVVGQTIAEIHRLVITAAQLDVWLPPQQEVENDALVRSLVWTPKAISMQSLTLHISGEETDALRHFALVENQHERIHRTLVSGRGTKINGQPLHQWEDTSLNFTGIQALWSHLTDMILRTRKEMLRVPTPSGSSHLPKMNIYDLIGLVTH